MCASNGILWNYTYAKNDAETPKYESQVKSWRCVSESEQFCSFGQREMALRLCNMCLLNAVFTQHWIAYVGKKLQEMWELRHSACVFYEQ